MRSRIFTTLLAVLGLPMVTLGAPKGNASAGKQVFAAHCQMCHGADGQGNAGLAQMLHTTIPPLGSKEVQALSDAQIQEVIEKGKGKMTPVQGLSSANVDNVIAFVRTLAKK
jgi:mono/diheme cytochrome c family protein